MTLAALFALPAAPPRRRLAVAATVAVALVLAACTAGWWLHEQRDARGEALRAAYDLSVAMDLAEYVRASGAEFRFVRHTPASAETI